MIIFLFGGAYLSTQVKKEIYPELKISKIEISVKYPAASPEEVDEGIVLAIEEQVRSLDGVKSITSHSYEEKASIEVEVAEGVDTGKLHQEIKTRVDSILSFPDNAERPIVSVVKTQKPVISLLVYGDQDPKTLKLIAEETLDELNDIPGITFVKMALVSPQEIGIEIPLRTLRKYNITLKDISNIVGKTSLDLPAGELQTHEGEVLIRTKEKRYFARDFETIPVITNTDGTNVLLGEIATINEQFEDTSLQAFFEGLRAVRLDIYQVGDEDPIEISKKVKDFSRKLEQKLPETVRIRTWNDQSTILSSRLELLTKNGLIGLLIVSIFLVLFLEPKLAIFSIMGAPISIIGSFVIIYFLGLSLNRISLYALVLTTGVIVNNIILVGVSIYQKRLQWHTYTEAAIIGAQRMSAYLILGVIVNMIIFLPMWLIHGTIGKLLIQIPSLLLCVFLVSLVDSLFVLPSRVSKKQKNCSGMYILLDIPNRKINRFLHNFYIRFFTPLLKASLKIRYLIVTLATCLFFLSVSFFYNGLIPFSILPKIDSDIVTAYVILPYGTPEEKSFEIQKRLVEEARKTLLQFGEKNAHKGVYGQIGEPIPETEVDHLSISDKGSHIIGAQVHLLPTDQRKYSSKKFSDEWKKKLGHIDEARVVSFSEDDQIPNDSLITIVVGHPNIDILNEASKEMTDTLNTFTELSQVEHKVSEGKPQITFRLSPEAKGLQISSSELGTQLRNAFYGSEALRLVRGKEEMKVLIRLPEEERESFSTLENLIIQTPMGGEIPISEATESFSEKAFTVIERNEGRRNQTINILVDPEIINPQEFTEKLQESIIPKFVAKHQGLKVELKAGEKPQTEFIQSLLKNYPAPLIALYTILVVMFRSTLQPFIVLICIPGAFVCAIFSHLLFGYSMSIFSIVGTLSLTGVISTNAIILVDFINHYVRERNLSVESGIVKGLQKCFPLFTFSSFITFIGLYPLITERSAQGQLIAPVAISLGIGVLFSTLILSFVATSFYYITHDIVVLFKKRNLSKMSIKRQLNSHSSN